MLTFSPPPPPPPPLLPAVFEIHKLFTVVGLDICCIVHAQLLVWVNSESCFFGLTRSCCQTSLIVTAALVIASTERSRYIGNFIYMSLRKTIRLVLIIFNETAALFMTNKVWDTSQLNIDILMSGSTQGFWCVSGEQLPAVNTWVKLKEIIY